MPEVFKCASCSAPHEFEGKTTQKCGFCGSTVIVPSDVFGRAESPNGIADDPAGRLFIANTSEILVIDSNGRQLKKLEAKQAFGIAFNDAGEMFVASRPFIIKYKLQF